MILILNEEGHLYPKTLLKPPHQHGHKTAGSPITNPDQLSDTRRPLFPLTAQLSRLVVAVIPNDGHDPKFGHYPGVHRKQTQNYAHL